MCVYNQRIHGDLLPTIPAMNMWNPPNASIIFPLSQGGERLRGDGRGG